MHSLLQDLRYGTRVLGKSPGFTAMALLTLALGIGATVSMFTVVHGVLLRPLPYAEPERIVMGWSERQGEQWATTPPDFYILREQQKTLEYLAAFHFRPQNLTGTGEPERLRALIASGDLFGALGVAPALGRGFTREEETWGRNRVVVLSHGLWQRRFGADPNILGRTINLSGADFTVIGVMGPRAKLVQQDAQLAIPMAFAPGDNYNTRNNYFLTLLGRVKPGVSVAQADADLDVIQERIAQQFPDTPKLSTHLEPLRSALVSNVRDALLMLMTAVGLLLLIGCANIANLLLARATGRNRELALRAALGASRLRLARQLLTESLLLAAGGGLAGTLLAYWTVEALPLLPERLLPRVEEVAVDGRVMLFALAVIVVTAVLAGIAPALQGARTNLNDALRECGRGSVSAGHPRLRAGLVVTEIALAMMLLVSAGLVGTSLMRLLKVDPGFDAENVLTMQLSLPPAKYVDETPIEQATPLNHRRATQFFADVAARLRTLPQVRAAGAVSTLPLAPGGWGKNINFFDRPEPKSLDEVPLIQYRVVSGDYFRAVGMTMLSGRPLDERDVYGAPYAAVINETLARQFWPGQDAVGKSFELAPPRALRPPGTLPPGYPPKFQVAGVVKDVKEDGLGAPVQPTVYVTHSQGAEGAVGMFLAVRTSGDPMTLVGDIRQIVAQLDPDLPLASVMSMRERLQDSVANPRLQTILLGGFSGLALLLAAVGIYGLMSYSVAQRRHEIGVRMALGAQPAQVLQLVLGSGLRLTVIGLLLGIAGGLAAGRLISALLFQVRPTDATTFAAVTVVLGSVALLASYIPARRATTVDPVVALRYE